LIEAGDPRAPALLLLHGFPMDSTEWRDLIPVFAERFHVIAPDLFTPAWNVLEEPADQAVSSRETAVRGLLAELGVEQLAVVGRGFGGAVALRLVAAGSGVQAAVLIGSVAPGTGLSEASAGLRAQVGALDPQLPLPAAVFGAAMAAGGGEAMVEMPPADLFLAAGGTGEFLRQIDAMNVVGNLDDLKVEVPVLMLWGEQDMYVPWSLGERLNEALPSSTLGLLPGCGHFLVQEAGPTIGPMIHEYLRAAYLHSPHGHEDTGPVMLQLGLAPPWADLAADEEDDWFDVNDEEDE
jgi:pimeloyl-ACP methyl ester carboxylesterase